MSSSLSSFPSFYIPRVFKNIGEERVIGVFESLGFGRVDHVDFVRRRGEKGDEYNSVYVHFATMTDSTMVRRFLDKLQNGDVQNPPRIVYDDPWYWIVLENKPQQARASASKPRIEFQGQSQSQSQGYSLFGGNDFPPLPQMLSASPALAPTQRSVHFQFPDMAYEPFAEPTPQPNDQAFVSADYANYLELEVERLQGELDAIREAKEADELLEEAIAAHYAQGDDA
jgi:hypothetical protein